MYYVYTYMYVHVYPSKSLSFSCLSPCSLPLHYPSYSHLILLENPSLLSISPPAVSLHTTLRLDFECRLFMSLVLPPESFLFVLSKLQLTAFHPERQRGEPLRCWLAPPCTSLQSSWHPRTELRLLNAVFLLLGYLHYFWFSERFLKQLHITSRVRV